ncbi:MAG: SWIM zinc finger domain-containing protein [Blastocatellia bacterium]
MSDSPEIRQIKTRLRANWNLKSEPTTKTGAYVDKFYARKRTGMKITACVVGNHGEYTVSIEVRDKDIRSGCGCYIGRDGGCHHCVALAYTFLQDAASFTEIIHPPRKALRTLDALAAYLEGVTLESLLDELKEKGITQKALAESIGMSSRHMSAVKSSELRNHYFHELGATKLACLWALEKIKAPAAQKKKKAK